MQYFSVKLKSTILVLAASACLLNVSAFAQQAPGNNNPPPGQDNGRPDRPNRDNNNRGGNGPGGNNAGANNPGNNQNGRAGNNVTAISSLSTDELEQQLQLLISDREIEAINTSQLGAPTISDAKAQLGKQLFFAKNLGGESSAACVSCHHPTLGGSDELSLSVGVDAVDVTNQQSHNLLGHGRFNGGDTTNLPSVPRNAPTVFNLVLNDRNMFWDSRVERRRNGAIVTPDSTTNEDGRRQPDANLPDGVTLAAAQARFPVTSSEEMRDNFLPGISNEELRNALATRFDNSDEGFVSTWPQAFELAYGDPAVNFDRIADSLGEYERSMVFVNSPWNNYLEGDTNALTEQQKRGAMLFFSNRGDGGAGCAGCHNGADFSNNRAQLVAFPQIGPGKGDDAGFGANHDFGREQVSEETEDRYHFRTPSLLNVAVTAPYGHSGAYQTLEQVVEHYRNPQAAIDRMFGATGGEAFVNAAEICQLPQIVQITTKTGQSCEDLYPNAYQNSQATIDHLMAARDEEVEARRVLRRNLRMADSSVADIVAFLHALTDPCVTNRECLSPWIIDSNNEANFPDDQVLIATDENLNEL